MSIVPFHVCVLVRKSPRGCHDAEMGESPLPYLCETRIRTVMAISRRVPETVHSVDGFSAGLGNC